MRTSTAAACLTVFTMMVLSSQSEASTIFDGSFSNYQSDGSGTVVGGVGTDTLTWGDPAGFGVGPSSVTYDEYEISTDVVLSGQPFAVGRITYFNGTIALGTGIQSATLFLRPLSDNDDLDVSDGFNVRMLTESTPNVGTPSENADYLFFATGVDDDLFPDFFNVFEGSSASADIMATLDFIPDLNFQRNAAGGQTGQYTLTVVGFANVRGGGFLTPAKINEVPEPSSLLILAVGIATGAGFARRRAKNQRPA